MTVLWTDGDAVAATGGTATTPFAATGLSIDTRSLAPGDLFIALTDRRDGHDFVANALAAGAAAALVSHRPDDVPEDAPLLIVDDVLDGLRDLATAARARTRAKVVGVTGSVGKTSTKDMLRHVLSGQGRVHAAERSFNNHWGVPLTLARCPVDADFAVIEIGMNHPGEIAPLARLADLDAAVVTNVAAVHLEAFDGVEAIAHEKAAIFDGLRRGATAVVNGDMPTSAILIAAAQTRGATLRVFGETDRCTDRLSRVALTGDGSQADLSVGKRSIALTLATVGRHFALNALATLTILDALGGDVAQGATDLTTWAPTAGRGTSERLTLTSGAILTLLDDAYNANPTSMAAALDSLAATTPDDGGRRIAVLGDMLELGPTEGMLHAALADLPAMGAIDQIVCVGPRMSALDAALSDRQRGGHFPDVAAVIKTIPSLLANGDVVMIKGSLGSKVSQLVTALRAQSTKGI